MVAAVLLLGVRPVLYARGWGTGKSLTFINSVITCCSCSSAWCAPCSVWWRLPPPRSPRESTSQPSLPEPPSEKPLQWKVISSHCKEISIYLFPEKELRGLNPNFYIHVSVSDLYIPRSNCLCLLQENRWGNILICSQTHECRTWDWGCAIHFLGIHTWDFRCSTL